MTPLILGVTLVALFRAYANGANDNIKGAATLFGSGTAPYRRTLPFATVATALGAASALLLGKALRAAFTGKGLVAPDVGRRAGVPSLRRARRRAHGPAGHVCRAADLDDPRVDRRVGWRRADHGRRGAPRSAGAGVSIAACARPGHRRRRRGALFGIGAVTGGGRVRTIARILLAWVVTLPMAGALAAGTAWAVQAFGR